jgi:peptidyl-prolyl cis-trans isomerase SurA
MSRSRVYLIFFFISLFFSHFLNAKEINIVAIVGDDIITNYDIEKRLNIISLTTGKIFSPREISTFRKQVREILITEALQVGEAKKYNINVSDAELNQNLKRIAKDNNLFLADFKSFLKRKGVTVRSFTKQMEAQIYWQKLVVAKIRPNISVTDFEISEYISSLGDAGNFEYKVKIASFPITSQKDVKSTKKLTQKFYNQVNNKKIKFSDVAKQFKYDNSKEVSWKLIKDLPENLRNHVEGLNKKQLSLPIHTEEAFYLIYLQDKRETSNRKINKDDIYRKLLIQKLEIKAANYLQNLHKTIYVERK